MNTSRRTSPAFFLPSGLRVPWPLRVICIVGLSAFAVFAYQLGLVAWHYPAAAMPALSGAVFGAYRAIRTRDVSAPHWVLSLEAERAYPTVLRWAILAGAIGYAPLAMLGLGVPDPAVSFGWRAFGGLALGATAGLGAFLFILTLHGVVLLWLSAWPPRIRRPNAT